MAHIIEIKDLAMPGLEVFARLTEAQLRSRTEPEQGIFIAESPKVIGYALDAGCQPVSLLMERRHLEGDARSLLARCGGVPVYTGERAVLEGLTGYALTRGVLCAMRRPRPLDADVLCAGARRVAVLENLIDASNVGAIFRSAAALGVDAVLLSPSCRDPLCRRTVRVSMGAVFKVPWARLGASAADWPGALCKLRALGFCTAALALGPRSADIRDARLSDAPKLAVVLGTEGTGLTPGAIAACEFAVRIPMSRGMDSLNVAAAASVAFWQLCAQRPAQERET